MSAIRDDGGSPRRAPAGDRLSRDDEAAARARLTALRRDAAAVYDTIVAADDELRTIAGQRVAAERALRAAVQRRDKAENALNEDAVANSGPRALLTAWLRQRRARHAALTAALDDCARSVTAARRAYEQAQASLAATVAARAEAAARLRGLTEECAAAQLAARPEPARPPRDPGGLVGQ